MLTKTLWQPRNSSPILQRKKAAHEPRKRSLTNANTGVRRKNIKGEWIAASGAGVEFPGDKTTIWVKLSETAKRVNDYAKKVTEEIQKYTEKKKPPLLTVAR